MHSLAVPASNAATPHSASLLVWAGFLVYVALILVLDIYILNRKGREPGKWQAAGQSLLFVALAAAAGVGIFAFTDFGATGAQQFASAYVAEWTLSLDNLFMIGLVLRYFTVPREYQHKVLFWGIIGAIVMRLLMVTLGLAAVTRWEFVMVLLGIWLIRSGLANLKDGEAEDVDVSRKIAVRLVNRFVPMTRGLSGERFFSHEGGRLRATPLFLALLGAEGADIMATGDSGPAGFGITHSTFILFAANIMAVMGLRSVFYLFGYLQEKFSRIGTGVAIILIFIGVKAELANDNVMKIFGYHEVDVTTSVTLLFILSAIALTLIASRIWPVNIEAEDVSLAGEVGDEETMVQLCVDASEVMAGEWNTDLTRLYATQCLHAMHGYDSDGSVPVYAYAERIESLGVDPRDNVDLQNRPDLGINSDLAAVLRHAEATARKTKGKYIFVIVTAGDLKDKDAQRAVRQAFVTMPNNAFVVFVRVSDAPGGAEFLNDLNDYNVKDGDRVSVIHATDDAGQPKEQISQHVGDELDAWLGLMPAAAA